MKTITSDFKNQIKEFGREFSNIIGTYGAETLLTSEDNKTILTQNDIKIIAKSKINEVDYKITDENIFNINLIQKGTIFSTMMKELDFESDIDLKIGLVVNYSFGIKIDEDYEYINYGDFIIYEKEFNEDTKTYSYTCYDNLLKSMILVDDTSLIENVTLAQAISNIAEKVNLEVTIDSELLEEYPNLEKTILEGTFSDVEITYRGVLDNICQAVGVSIYADNNELKFKSLKTDVVDTIDSEYLKDVNVTFKEKYGPVNSLVLSRGEGYDNIYRQDETSVNTNGLHEFKIKNNLILEGENREEYIDNIFEQIKGLEFYVNDYESVGIMYLDWLDYYNVNIDSNNYKCLMLNDEIKIRSGISESAYTEQPEEAVTDYTTASKTDKDVSFIVDKQNAVIKSKVSQDEMESAIEQKAGEINIEVSKKVGNDEIISKINQSPEQISINANKVSLQGKTIALTGDNINITSDKFSVDSSGNLSCSSANITGGSINLSASQANDRVQVGGTTAGGSNVYARMGWAYFDLYRDGARCLRLHCGATTPGGIIQVYDGSGNDNITLVGSSGKITCISLTQTSLESQKKNFEKFKNALDIIKLIDIYKFNYKNEENNDKKHIGFVIGDKYNYSDIVTSVDEEGKENGVELYSFVSVCCQAIKEQQEEIELLKKEIEILKERIDL